MVTSGSSKNNNKKKRSKTFKVLVGLIIALGVFELAAFGALAYYISDDYDADADAEKALKSSSGVRVTMAEDWIEFAPSARSQAVKCDRPAAGRQASDAFGSNALDTGIIFYPGGKVEYTAYSPLMQGFAKEGYFCALVKMPFGLAVFDTNAAKDVKEAHPEITHWIIGGHSLGGAMAAKYAAISDFDGLFLLAAYTTTGTCPTKTSLWYLSTVMRTVCSTWMTTPQTKATSPLTQSSASSREVTILSSVPTVCRKAMAKPASPLRSSVRRPYVLC